MQFTKRLHLSQNSWADAPTQDRFFLLGLLSLSAGLLPAGFDSSSAFFSLAAFAFGVAAVFGDFFSSLRALLTRVSPSATRCRRSPKIAAARLEAPRLVHGHTSETATHTHGHRQTDTHTHQHINAQRDSWPWKYSCSRLHLSSCTSRIYPGSPSSAPGFSWAYFWFGHLGIGV